MAIHGYPGYPPPTNKLPMTFIICSTILGRAFGPPCHCLGRNSKIRPFSGLWCVYELATFLRHGQAQQVKLFPVAMARVLLVIASSSVPVTWIQLILAVETAPAKLG